MHCPEVSIKKEHKKGISGVSKRNHWQEGVTDSSVGLLSSSKDAFLKSL